MAKGEQKIGLYVDAVRAMRALQEAEKLEGKTEDRTRLLKAAKNLVSERSRPLTGGMIGKAQRMLQPPDTLIPPEYCGEGDCTNADGTPSTV